MAKDDRRKLLSTAFAAGLLLLALGCDSASKSSEPRAPASVSDSSRKSPSAAKAGANTATGPKQSSKSDAATQPREFRYPGGERVVAIGDLHGDIEATQAAFRLAGAIDEAGEWSGGKLIVVQTGDQLDRGDGEREILDFIERLQKEATAAGGALYVLNGNHETMNVLGDFRYVTPGGVHDFDDAHPKAATAHRYPSVVRGRAAAFLPGGEFAKRLAERDLIAIVGDSVFVHGGVRPPHVDHGVGKLNAETSAWMRGELSQPPRLVVDPEGPLWTRVYGSPDLDEKACTILEQTLKKLGVKRMVIGHTVQERGISPACNEQVWRIDVGLSRHYGGKTIEVLEIQGDRVKALSGPRPG